VTLALGGIAVVLGAVFASMGFLALLGLPSSLIIIEVVPFLVLAVGADNIFIFVQEYQVGGGHPGGARGRLGDGGTPRGAGSPLGGGIPTGHEVPGVRGSPRGTGPPLCGAMPMGCEVSRVGGCPRGAGPPLGGGIRTEHGVSGVRG